LCYTDAIDNSAGVDTSDHEVNIKILLNAAMRGKQLSPAQRNRLLAGMQAEVGEMVPANNYAPAQTSSLEAARGPRALPPRQTPPHRRQRRPAPAASAMPRTRSPTPGRPQGRWPACGLSCP